MPRARKKGLVDTQAETAARTETSENTQAVPSETEEPPHSGQTEAPAREGEESKWVNKLPDPQTRHGIHLGDDRKIVFGRSNQFQQVHIFLTAPDGVDPRPSKDDTQFLKENGFRWRAEEQAWSRQLLSPEDKAAIEAIKGEKGEHEAAKERSRRRSANDAQAQEVFVTLANRIRERNGQDPIDYTFAQERQR